MNRAVVIKADGTEYTLDHRPTLAEAQEIVGGYIGLVKARNTDTATPSGVVTLVVDDEGKMKRKPTNYTVTKLYGSSIYKGYIVGDVIVLEGWLTVGGSS